MIVRRTFVCRPTVDAKGQPSCSGGGFWTDADVPPGGIYHGRCGKRMTELAPTYVSYLSDRPLYGAMEDGGMEGTT